MLNEAQCPYQLRPSRLPPLPSRVASLPIDKRGYPIPYFVDESKGEIDFRVKSGEHLAACVGEKRCWVCGQPLGHEKVFVIEPTCSILRVSSEPPSHGECAVWSAQNCPFLSKRHVTRLFNGGSVYSQDPVVEMICSNPGVTLVWYTTRFQLLRLPGGVLWKLGSPFKWEWFYRGRIATRNEVVNSIEIGLPVLEEEARRKGVEATQELKHFMRQHLRFLPPEQRMKKTASSKHQA